eukprot:CAMPEP_0175092784 /NCGR_PEP_ID=MMETSP0086_2-20121207/2649_1 /TAXON_ID=136419 /ORGANISM="Unknown Unknown, Strain D1" /LENGTH=257 /DNA_ID=CAMNT_0016365673 /DNA_START=90 /DNA_END=861 /DNA_ORIENTATION=+
MLKPARDAFASKLDFKQLKSPLDKFALSIGQRWLEESGGLELMNQSKIPYSEYLVGRTKAREEDVIQIKKDIGRTKASSMTQKTLRDFMIKMNPKKLKEQLGRVLLSFCIRQSHLGYAQGMDYIVFFLSAFMAEEHVFWTFCGMVEKLMPQDFYSPPPQMMNGFLTEKKLTILLAEQLVSDDEWVPDEKKLTILLAEQIFPKLVKKVGKSQLQNVLEIMAPKWMICMFVDSVPLDANCMVFQSFFHRKGHLGTAAAI